MTSRHAARAARVALANLRRIQSASRAELRAQEKAMREEGRRGVAAARKVLGELRESIRHADAAARKLAPLIVPGARATLDAKAEAQRAELARKHAAEIRQARGQTKGAQAAIDAYKREREGARAKDRERRRRAEERQAESDDEVLNNLETDDARTLFYLIGHAFKASPRMSRTEAFMHWIHDHAGVAAQLVRDYQERQAERMWRATVNASSEDEAERAVAEIRNERPAPIRKFRPTTRQAPASAPQVVIAVQDDGVPF